MSDCRGCDGTCCTGVGSEPCSCEPREAGTDEPSAVMQLILEALGPTTMKTTEDYLAFCPAHAENLPSLSIKDFGDHGLLIKCYAGCSPDRVLAEFGLTTAYLSNNNTNQD